MLDEGDLVDYLGADHLPYSIIPGEAATGRVHHHLDLGSTQLK